MLKSSNLKISIFFCIQFLTYSTLLNIIIDSKLLSCLIENVFNKISFTINKFEYLALLNYTSKKVISLLKIFSCNHLIEQQLLKIKNYAKSLKFAKTYIYILFRSLFRKHLAFNKVKNIIFLDY